MKKFISLFLTMVFVLSFAGCGGENTTSTITIDDVTKALQAKDANFTFDAEEKPLFEMIGAEDGWIGYFDETSLVKVYKYADEKSYKKAVENFEIMKDWPKVGLFVLESRNDSVISAFQGLA